MERFSSKRPPTQIRPRAEAVLENAARGYEEERLGLAQRFLNDDADRTFRVSMNARCSSPWYQATSAGRCCTRFHMLLLSRVGRTCRCPRGLAFETQSSELASQSSNVSSIRVPVGRGWPLAMRDAKLILFNRSHSCPPQKWHGPSRGRFQAGTRDEALPESALRWPSGSCGVYRDGRMRRTTFGSWECQRPA
jgi:hypothetical protein